MQENETNDLVEEVSEIECTETAPEKIKKNGVVVLLHWLAVAIYFFGGILGLVTLYQGGFREGLFMMLSTWISYAIYGSLVLGMSELLRQLERIADK